MIRTTITLDEELAQELDAYIQRSGAANRSEAVRDLVRRGLNSAAPERSDSQCMAVISYAIDQQIEGLAKRRRLERQERHDEFLMIQSFPVNHRWSLDVTVMRSSVARVSDYSEQLFLERGVRHGSAALLPLGQEDEHSHDGEGSTPHRHIKFQQSF